MLKLSKAQYKQLCADCAADMMRGAGHGGAIPDFHGTDMQFFVKDNAMRGGGFTDTLSSTWNKVKQFVSESPLAQKVVKQGLTKGKALAKDVAGKAVQMGLGRMPSVTFLPRIQAQFVHGDRKKKGGTCKKSQEIPGIPRARRLTR